MPVAIRRSVRAIAALGVAATFVGCTDLLGFNRIAGGGCVVPTDCPGGLSCVDGVCGAQEPGETDASTDKGAPDGGAPSDAGSVAVGAGPSLLGEASDSDGPTAEAVACDPVCAPVNECGDGQCIQALLQGAYQDSPTQGFTFTDQVVCFQEWITVCGDLTALALEFNTGIHGQLRLAVYEDNGGNPSELFAETGDYLMEGTRADIPVTPVSSVGCDAAHDAYWMCIALGLSPTGAGVALTTVPGASRVKLVVMDASPGLVGDYADGGFPATWSGSGPLECDQPVLYPWIAHR